MSLVTMQQELMGDVPGLSLPYSQTLINRALGLIYDEQRWSFQVSEGGWLTPGILGGSGNVYQSAGTITVAPYATTITGDAVASALWTGLVGRPFLTEMQIRVPSYSLYNIISVDASTPTAVVLTIDRPWMEPAQTLGTYMIYQAYFPVPTSSFRKFGVIRDTTNNAWVNFWQRDQAWLSVNDPQRTVFDQPAYAVPYEVDQRPGSATLGNMLYELWPHPLSVLPYTFTFLQRGSLLALPTDTVPYPLNDELVTWRAKEVGYLWKESQKGDGMQRGTGADWRFLSQDAHEQYAMRLKTVKLIDVGLGDLYWSKFNRTAGTTDGYETTLGTLNVGTF
jgi:hypothetical protein